MKHAVFGLTLGLLLACSPERTAAPAPSTLPPLATATWRVHRADGQALPALVGHRLSNGVLEQIFLDSAQVAIDSAGRWQQRLWMQRFHDGVLEGSLAEQDAGAWAIDGAEYRFTSDLNGVRFTFGAITTDSLRISLRSPVFDGIALATLRQSAAPAAPVGTWHADAVAEAPMPSAIYVFDPVVLDGDTVSVHFIVDTARITLLPTGRYEHAIRYSEWIGPKSGGPTQRRFRWQWNDFGTWTRNGIQVAFESGYYQNHRMTAEFAGTGPLRVRHGLSHGDPPVGLRYVR
ncbi:MAG: hypothetical protein IT357_18910 [Gemmatimonadaceae bacterium]|nr:hypothetical protein [Gemmatimonadaceae bacterium]